MRFVTSLILLLFVSFNSLALSYSNETLNYKVMFKWGLINKQAGRATLSIRDVGSEYRCTLVARSESWADRFYTVRDTLNGIIRKDGFKPLFYEKIAHEGSEDKHDVVRFEYSGSTVTGNCSRRVVKDGELKVDQQLTLTSTGTTVDMLSSFYYMRALPFHEWQIGQEQSITIFSGKRKEVLTFKYSGQEILNLNDKKYHCYKITFIFTSDGGKKTSDDMIAWITTDSSRLAVQLEGKLPVGKVRCQLVE